MMIATRLLGPTLSLLVLGAHFLRSGQPVLVLAALLLVGLQFVRRAWVPPLLQVVLTLGGAEWVRTLLQLRAERVAAGEPAARMVVILAVVAAVTLLSALAYRAPVVRRHFKVAGSGS